MGEKAIEVDPFVPLSRETPFPRMIQFESLISVLPISKPNIPSPRPVQRLGNWKMQQDIVTNDDFYKEYDLRIEAEQSACQLRAAWQSEPLHPDCNRVHELDVLGSKHFNHLATGAYRHVFAVDSGEETYIFKALRYKRDFTLRNLDRMRREALIMEQLSTDQTILDIYSACGASGFFEYADGGDLEDTIWGYRQRPKLSLVEKLRVGKFLRSCLQNSHSIPATRAAMSLASLHNVDGEGVATIAHSDVNVGQWVKVGDHFKLNDFNRARFLTYNGTNVCPFFVTKNAGTNRSPEEYAYQGETEKVDVYSLGNIFFMLLQEEKPFAGRDSNTVANKLMKGERPVLRPEVDDSKDPIVVALRYAIQLCHEQDPVKRSSAREVEEYLRKVVADVESSRIEVHTKV